LKLPAETSGLAPFRWRDFRRLFAGTACSVLASRAVAVVMGYEVYELTDSPLALGILGLVEAIPAVSLALYGGHVADRRDRRTILSLTFGALTLCTLALAMLEFAHLGHAKLFGLYVVVFISGIARGFSDPAAGALEAQVVPWSMLVSSSVLMAGCWQGASVIGPLIGGVAYYQFGPGWTYAGLAILYALAWLATSGISAKPIPDPPADETVWQSVAAGVRYVVRDQILLGSMALDLFAVLFGGAIALLPVFARDILSVGPIGLGFLNATPTLGSLLTMFLAARRPPVERAGRNLFLAVGAFGVAMIVFALSTSFYLSLAALFVSGACDGLSVVIRRSIVRLMSPEALRGRIASVSMIFIRSSNEFGAFESGVAASLLGTATSVWAGGVVTLLVVVGAAVLAPKLRQLNLDPNQIRPRDIEPDQSFDAMIETSPCDDGLTR
jgi:MFS family permease